jgi:hypothetical protein
LTIVGVTGLLLLVLPACMTTKQMAPPIETTFIDHAGKSADLEQLRRGRTLYVTNCTKCHTVEPINRYSMRRWHRTMIDMTEESKMTETQEKDVMAYIHSAHAFMTWLDKNPNVKKKLYESYLN